MGRLLFPGGRGGGAAAAVAADVVAVTSEYAAPLSPAPSLGVRAGCEAGFGAGCRCLNIAVALSFGIPASSKSLTSNDSRSVPSMSSNACTSAEWCVDYTLIQMRKRRRRRGNY